MPPALPIELPAPVASFLSARNRRDYETAVAAFAPNAEVADEGGVHRGRPAIRLWMEDTVRKYDDTAEVVAVDRDNGTLGLAVRISGKFAGSPAMLRFAFTFADDLITRLEIGA